jgi:hypothetical protein
MKFSSKFFEFGDNGADSQISMQKIIPDIKGEWNADFEDVILDNLEIS